MRRKPLVVRRFTSLIIAILQLAAPLALALEPVAADAPPSEAPADPLDRGLALYREGEYRLAAETFEAARREHPVAPEGALLLGLTRLRLDQPAEAARQWREAVDLGEDASWVADLRRSLTLVAREADRHDARLALAAGAKAAATADAQRVAVLPFRSTPEELGPTARALAAFVAENLAALPGLTVVDPDRVDVFLAESSYAKDAASDGAAARRLAAALGAGRVVIGTLREVAADPARWRLEARLFEAGAERETGRFDAEALAADFHTLVPTLAPEIATALGASPDALGAERSAALGAEHTRAVAAATAFGLAREGMAGGDDTAARDEAERAVREDGDFRLARELSERLPAAQISLVAVANSVEGGIVPSLSTRKGGGPSRRTLLLLGGAAAVAGAAGIALAAGGGSGGGGGDDPGDAPTIEGVSDGSVAVGQVFRLDVTARDPDGGEVTLEANLSNVQPRGTFTIVSNSGSVKTGRFEYRPAVADVGVRSVTFTARADDDPPQTASATARITVGGGVVASPTPGITPSTSATPTATRTATQSPTPTRTATPTL